MTATATQTRTDRHGFPIVTCYRCLGTGAHGPSSVHGGRCFDCNGRGLVYKRGKSAKANAEYREALARAKRPTVARVNPGDSITFDVQWTTVRTDAVYRTVDTITVHDDRPSGWSVAPDGARTETAWRCTITYTDGTTKDTSTNTQCVRRGVTVDPAPFVEAATR